MKKINTDLLKKCLLVQESYQSSINVLNVNEEEDYYSLLLRPRLILLGIIPHIFEVHLFIDEYGKVSFRKQYNIILIGIYFFLYFLIFLFSLSPFDILFCSFITIWLIISICLKISAIRTLIKIGRSMEGR